MGRLSLIRQHAVQVTQPIVMSTNYIHPFRPIQLACALVLALYRVTCIQDFFSLHMPITPVSYGISNITVSVHEYSTCMLHACMMCIRNDNREVLKIMLLISEIIALLCMHIITIPELHAYVCSYNMYMYHGTTSMHMYACNTCSK